MILWGIVVASGQIQQRIRFANAQMLSSPAILLAVQPYGPINGLVPASNGAYSMSFSDYLPLPQPEMPLGQQIPFYLSFNGNQLTSPINITLTADQSYTMVATGPSFYDNQTIPTILFNVAELPPNPDLNAGQAFFKVINAIRKI